MSDQVRSTPVRMQVTFPSGDIRGEFLEQVRLWNRLEGLPPIGVETLGDGVGVRLSSDPSSQRRVLQLVAAYGGWLDNRRWIDRPSRPRALHSV